MTKPGRESREARVSEGKGGVWASSSQDFLHLANLLYHASALYAKQTDGNCSIYALAGIPVLFSGIRCLLIELNGGMHGDFTVRQSVLDDLARFPNDVSVIAKHYKPSDDLKQRLELLYEVRNELVHPAHRPGSEPHGTPAYLAKLRRDGLLQSTGSDSDYVWIAQLQSHKLYKWAFDTIAETVDVLLLAHDLPQFAVEGLKYSYAAHSQSDAA
jgi:hypothetical protein